MASAVIRIPPGDGNASPKPRLPDKPLALDWPGLGSSNGPNWAAYFSLHFNYSQVYAFNMAFGGATVDRGIVCPFQDYIWTLREQIQKFLVTLGNHPNTVAWPYPWTSDNGLFFFWFGINDIWRSHGEWIPDCGVFNPIGTGFQVDNGAGEDWLNVSQSNLHDKTLTSYFAGIEEVCAKSH
ncbi:hypothetical protein L211DRAFT_837603 [Terfezia boudieri ATCC MYA-4762]|uniref:Carbohydrate esterase family 16 protein n=1 Tax=Terfezia boudieri ATCC MYA-4762 TaxID=1051890 RepID=A0A3N4M1P6_9PEZI|nr:hypothetical protein L211DRAFT_837603 [Terfezia boudieri ATCC MYA-4762]